MARPSASTIAAQRVPSKGRGGQRGNSTTFGFLEEHVMTAHEDALKGQAKRLRSALAEDGVVLGHRKILDLVAKLHGWRNWHVLSAALDHSKSPSTDQPLLPILISERETTSMSKQTDGTVSAYLQTTVTTTNSTSVVDIFNALPASIGDWRRDPATEARAARMGGTFVHFIRQDVQEPLLAFAVSSDGQSAYVANVVPPPNGQDITLKEANRLEAELVDLLRPLLPIGVQIKQNALTMHLRDLLRPATYQQFKYHSGNKSTGNSHSGDRRRWLAFVAQAVQEGMDDRDEHVELIRLALLEEGFAERHANDISQNYAIQVEAMQSMLT